MQLVPPVEGYGFKIPILPKDYIAYQLATEASEIRNPALLQEVLALPEIKATRFYQWYGDNFDKCLYEFQDLLSVSPVRDTYLIRVSIAVRDREEARLIVNRVVDRYVTRSRSTFTDEGRRKLETLKSTKAAAVKDQTDNRNRIKDAPREAGYARPRVRAGCHGGLDRGADQHHGGVEGAASGRGGPA